MKRQDACKGNGLRGSSVCMFVLNRCFHDARVLKEARSLVDAGFSVKVVAVGRSEDPAHEVRDGFCVFRVHARGPGGSLGERIVAGEGQNDPARSPVRVCGVSDEAPTVGGADAVTSTDSRLATLGMRHTARRVAAWLGRSLRWCPLRSLHRLVVFGRYYVLAYAYVKEVPAAVYHAHDLNTLPVAWWAARRLGGRLVFDSHELYTEVATLSRRERRFWRLVERFLIRRCDAVITVNESIAAELEKRYSIARPAVVMNCPVLPDRVGPSSRLRDVLGLRDDSPLVLYQGGFSPNRGLENLLTAVALLPSVKLVMMGFFRIEADLRRLCEDLDLLGTRVFFLPPVSQEDLLSWTASADVGVIPYQSVGLNNYYSLPNKLFEYLGAGIPVAVSNLPELARVVDTCKVGYTFDPDDPQDIARAIRRITGDSAHLEELKARVRVARERFRWQIEERKLLAIYERLKA